LLFQSVPRGNPHRTDRIPSNGSDSLPRIVCALVLHGSVAWTKHGYHSWLCKSYAHLPYLDRDQSFTSTYGNHSCLYWIASQNSIVHTAWALYLEVDGLVSSDRRCEDAREVGAGTPTAASQTSVQPLPARTTLSARLQTILGRESESLDERFGEHFPEPRDFASIGYSAHDMKESPLQIKRPPCA